MAYWTFENNFVWSVGSIRHFQVAIGIFQEHGHQDHEEEQFV